MVFNFLELAECLQNRNLSQRTHLEQKLIAFWRVLHICREHYKHLRSNIDLIGLPRKNPTTMVKHIYFPVTKKQLTKTVQKTAIWPCHRCHQHNKKNFQLIRHSIKIEPKLYGDHIIVPKSNTISPGSTLEGILPFIAEHVRNLLDPRPSMACLFALANSSKSIIRHPKN